LRRFKLIAPVRNVEIIAAGRSVQSLKQLQRRFGQGRWRKLKGISVVEFDDGEIRDVELHWYEAHGIGKVWMKVKRYVD
jgi:hypothetical protein